MKHLTPFSKTNTNKTFNLPIPAAVLHQQCPGRGRHHRLQGLRPQVLVAHPGLGRVRRHDAALPRHPLRPLVLLKDQVREALQTQEALVEILI